MNIDEKKEKRQLPLLNSKESYRLHEDWWGKCRTCEFWKSEDRWEPGLCQNKKSPMFEQETWTEGHCQNWDSFDYHTALKILEDDEINSKIGSRQLKEIKIPDFDTEGSK